jgi:hypothetical protein
MQAIDEQEFTNERKITINLRFFNQKDKFESRVS